MAVHATETGMRFTAGVVGRVVGAVSSLAFMAAGIAIMYVARGPAMPGPLFVVVAGVALVAIARSIGIELTIDSQGISQSSSVAGGWSLAWTQVASWQLLQSQSHYGVVLVDTGSRRHRVSSFLAGRHEMRTLIDQIEQRLGPPTAP